MKKNGQRKQETRKPLSADQLDEINDKIWKLKGIFAGLDALAHADRDDLRNNEQAAGALAANGEEILDEIKKIIGEQR